MRRLLATLALASAPLFAAEPYHWYYYTIDTTEIRGFSEPAFTKAGHLRVGYRRQYQVWHGELDGHGFRIEKADTGIGANGKVVFAIDNNNRSRIFYHDDVYQYVYLATHDGTKWNHQTIDKLNNGTVDFYHIDMAPADDGGLHLIYSKRQPAHQADNSLYYARVDAAGKVGDSQFVADGLNGKWNSVTTDKDGKPIVAYFRHFGESLVLGYADGSTRFKEQTVGLGDPNPQEGFYPSIKRLADNSYYIAHQDKNENRLVLSHGVPGGSWNRVTIDTAIGFSLFHSPSMLALGKNDQPFISYVRITAPQEDSITACRLMLARYEGNKWVKETVDSVGIVGEYASIAVSPDGLPAISYYDRTNKRLRMAVARKEAPADKNNNGVPDYQEVSIRKVVRLNLASAELPSRVYDLRGKAWKSEGGRIPAQGIWLVPSGPAFKP